jgi:uncharacterized membrane protein
MENIDPGIVLLVFFVVLTLSTIWSIRVQNKQEKNVVEKTLLFKLPWVKTAAEIRALEEKSSWWFIVTIPYRILSFLPYSAIRLAVFPVVVLTLLGILLYSFFK